MGKREQNDELWDLHFLHQVAKDERKLWDLQCKWQNDELWDLHFLHNEANVAKINDELCTFCTMRQKWQNDALWDLHFLHNEAKVAK